MHGVRSQRPATQLKAVGQGTEALQACGSHRRVVALHARPAAQGLEGPHPRTHSRWSVQVHAIGSQMVPVVAG